jgi:DNA-binding response OmpR family regulator
MRSSLIVTPDKELANLIRTSLSDNDRVDMIDNLDGALAVFKKNPFDVIFADLSILKDGIPDLNLTESILSFKRTHPRLKVVVLAPKERIRDAVKVVKSVADDYLTYPIDPSEIQLIDESLSDSLNMEKISNPFIPRFSMLLKTINGRATSGSWKT